MATPPPVPSHSDQCTRSNPPRAGTSPSPATATAASAPITAAGRAASPAQYAAGSISPPSQSAAMIRSAATGPIGIPKRSVHP
jgi:hypothetical protein